jgi:hypothetical protein
MMRLLPNIPRETATEISRFAAEPHQGRVLVGIHKMWNIPSNHHSWNEWNTKIIKAVCAHVRHNMTDYDTILLKMPGYCEQNKAEARKKIRPQVDTILKQWGLKLEPTISES